MHEVLVNRLGGLSLPRKSVVRLTDRPDMTLDVYRGRKTTIQQQQSAARMLNLTGVIRMYTKLLFPRQWLAVSVRMGILDSTRSGSVDSTHKTRTASQRADFYLYGSFFF